MARSGWTPTFFSNLTTRNQTNPPTDIFGGDGDAITDQRFTSQAGVQQALPWGGASYHAAWNSGRVTTNNVFSSFNPQLNSTVSANYTQPLLRNFKIDATRQQVLVSRKNREISDVQLQQSIAVTTRNVKNAYWDLVFAINNLDVQRQSLQLAQQSFRDNRARVEIGTMAPIDIVAGRGRSRAARRGRHPRRGGDLARGRHACARSSRTRRPAGLLEHAARAGRRGDLPAGDGRHRRRRAQRARQAHRSRRLAQTDRSQRHLDPLLPQPVAAGRQRAGQLQRDRPRRHAVQLRAGVPAAGPRARRSAGSSARSATRSRPTFPTWSLQLQVNYPIGASNAEANLARARLQNPQALKQLQSDELQIATQIRDFARNVQTNSKRVEATRASRALAEKRLEAEEKKFQAGMTSSFLVFQAQRDLSQARNNELQAIIDYLKSVVDFETAQQVAARGGGADLAGLDDRP